MGVGNEQKMSRLVLTWGLHLRTKWNVYQVIHFLDSLLATQAVYREFILRIGDAYGFTCSRNAEVRCRWSQLLVRHNIQDKQDYVKEFLLSQGSMKYTLPVYKQLVKTSSEEGTDEKRWR